MGEETKCPNCGAARAASASECLGCGLIFAKWQAKRERIQDIPDGPALLDSPPASEIVRYKRIAVGVAAAFGILTSFLIGRVMHRAGGKVLGVLATQAPTPQAAEAMRKFGGEGPPPDPKALMRALEQAGPDGSNASPEVQRALEQAEPAQPGASADNP